MPPVVIPIVMALIQNSPEIIAMLKQLFSGGADPTPADWQALHDRVLAKAYEQYDPGSVTPMAEAFAVNVSRPSAAPSDAPAPVVVRRGAP